LTPLIVAGFHLGVEALPPPTADVHEHSGNPSYEVMHSGRFVLIDRQGRIRAYYDSQDFDPERIVSDIRALLEE
jgi:cytochrome oxidase Cu insertion factor (SCO1/SenC/PrrC family)